jgi:hypothetical protein
LSLRRRFFQRIACSCVQRFATSLYLNLQHVSPARTQIQKAPHTYYAAHGAHAPVAPRFYFWFALVFVAIAIIGFAPSYAGAAGPIPAIVHVHGALLFAWTILLVVQTRLARSSLQTHRALGLVGIALATAMVFTALAITVRGLGLAVENGNEASGRAISIAPLFAIGAFAIFFALAAANVRTPERHKRFMILASVAVMPPALARMLFHLFAPEGAELVGIAGDVPDLGLALNLLIVPAALGDALLIAPAVYDWRTRGRVHRVYVIGGLCLLASQALRPVIAGTEVWHGVTNALLTLGQ